MSLVRFLLRLILGLVLLIPALIVFEVRYLSFSFSFKGALRSEGMTRREARVLAAECSPLALWRLLGQSGALKNK